VGAVSQVTNRIGPFLTPAIPIKDRLQDSLNAKAGETCYLDLHVGEKRHVSLRLLDPDKARRMLASAAFSTSQPK
jgi:hypothetical protein